MAALVALKAKPQEMPFMIKMGSIPNLLERFKKGFAGSFPKA
jgi:hypothetical protein